MTLPEPSVNLDSTLSQPCTVETILRADDGNGTPEYRAWVAGVRERRHLS